MSGMLERQVSAFPDQLKLIRFEPDVGRARYVFLTIQPDLFGGAMLVAEWGRAGASGRLVRRVFADEGRADTVQAGRGLVRWKDGIKMREQDDTPYFVLPVRALPAASDVLEDLVKAHLA